MISSNLKTQENTSQAITLSRWLAGEYSSVKYTLEIPRTNPHIRIFFRPLPYIFFGGIGFYSEEIYDHDPWHPHYHVSLRCIVTQEVVQCIGCQQASTQLMSCRLTAPPAKYSMLDE